MNQSVQYTLVHHRQKRTQTIEVNLCKSVTQKIRVSPQDIVVHFGRDYLPRMLKKHTEEDLHGVLTQNT